MRFIESSAFISRDLACARAVALLGQGKTQIVAALVTASMPYFAPRPTAQASAERRKDYIEAAAATPCRQRASSFRHLLPNPLPPLIVVATVQIANANRT